MCPLYRVRGVSQSPQRQTCDSSVSCNVLETDKASSVQLRIPTRDTQTCWCMSHLTKNHLHRSGYYASSLSPDVSWQERKVIVFVWLKTLKHVCFGRGTQKNFVWPAGATNAVINQKIWRKSKLCRKHLPPSNFKKLFKKNPIKQF